MGNCGDDHHDIGGHLAGAVLGLATFLLGFSFAFANILKNVGLRGDKMAAALPLIKKQQQKV